MRCTLHVLLMCSGRLASVSLEVSCCEVLANSEGTYEDWTCGRPA